MDEPALMCTNNKLRHIKQQNFYNNAKKNHLNIFFDVLNNPELSSTVNETLPECRNRLYPPLITLSMFISQALHSDRSCQNIVNIAAIERMKNNLPSSSVLTGAYCRARQRLPLEMISRLVQKTGTLTHNLVPKQWRWREKRVHLIDGTTLTMPDKKDNQATYPQQIA
jgi:hypothetical protein